jgi:hypothetical protein
MVKAGPIDVQLCGTSAMPPALLTIIAQTLQGLPLFTAGTKQSPARRPGFAKHGTTCGDQKPPWSRSRSSWVRMLMSGSAPTTRPSVTARSDGRASVWSPDG